MTKFRLRAGRAAHLAIGLMAGTSHDRVSAALVRIHQRRRPHIYRAVVAESAGLAGEQAVQRELVVTQIIN